MGRMTLRLMALVVMLVLLAACGSDTDDNDSSRVEATIEPVSALTANQLVGQWMDRDGNRMEFHRDGSISGFTDGDFVAATYAVATRGERLRPILLLNTTNGSVYAREFDLRRLVGCGDHLFGFQMQGDGGFNRVWWYIGGEDFDTLRGSELRAHPWSPEGYDRLSYTFNDDGTMTTREGNSPQETLGTWSLDGNELHIAIADESGEGTVSVVNVSRCNGRPLVITLHMDEVEGIMVDSELATMLRFAP